MDDRELLNRIAELPREIRPATEVWPRISARIGRPDARSPGRNAGRRGWALGAVAAVAVAALALNLMPVKRQSHEEAPMLAEQSRPAQAVPYGGFMASSEAEYQAAFREFIAVGDSREQLPVTAVEQIETGWADLMHAETALSGALAENPNDPFLNNRMLELRARQLGFLKQLATLERSNRRLTI